jgi:hypothetical protein
MMSRNMLRQSGRIAAAISRPAAVSSYLRPTFLQSFRSACDQQQELQYTSVRRLATIRSYSGHRAPSLSRFCSLKLTSKFSRPALQLPPPSLLPPSRSDHTPPMPKPPRLRFRPSSSRGFVVFKKSRVLPRPVASCPLVTVSPVFMA